VKSGNVLDPYGNTNENSAVLSGVPDTDDQCPPEPGPPENDGCPVLPPVGPQPQDPATNPSTGPSAPPGVAPAPAAKGKQCTKKRGKRGKRKRRKCAR
jgi:hypothetical protein